MASCRHRGKRNHRTGRPRSCPVESGPLSIVQVCQCVKFLTKNRTRPGKVQSPCPALLFRPEAIIKVFITSYPPFCSVFGFRSQASPTPHSARDASDGRVVSRAALRATVRALALGATDKIATPAPGSRLSCASSRVWRRIGRAQNAWCSVLSEQVWRSPAATPSRTETAGARAN